MDEADIEDFYFNTQKEFDPDLHLQEAIRYDSRKLVISHFLDARHPIPPDLRIDAHLLTGENINAQSLRIDSEKLYPLTWYVDIDTATQVKPTPHHPESEDNLKSANISINARMMTDALSVAKELTNTNIRGLDDFSGTNSNELKENVSMYYHPPALVAYNKVRLYWYHIRNQMYHRKRIQGSSCKIEKILPPNKYIDNIYLLKNMLVIEIKKILYLMDYTQVLMIHDTATSRYLSMLTASIAPNLNLPNIPSRELLTEFYDWGDNLVRERGNKAYTLIKMIEPICVSLHLNTYDRLKTSHKFYDELLTQLNNEEDKQSIIILYELLKLKCDNMFQLFEMFGCYRHFGHPTVDEESGCEKMREQTRKEVDIDEEMVQQVTGAWNRFFILNFIKKNTRWPLCSSNLPEGHVLSRMIKNNILHLDDYMTRIDLKDWASITFEKEFEFDYYPDFLELLSDTSLSPYLLNWYKVYSRDLINVRESGQMRESRRVLMEILGRPNISVEDICMKIQLRKVPDGWMIVGLHSKERELKISARLFAMLVIELRLYFCATEANIAKSIFKYMTCQTMTWSETDLLKHIHHVTQSQGSGKYVIVTISLDFEKWNNRWRDKTVRPIFSNISSLLGVPNLFEFSHEFFENSYFYLSSHLNPPTHIKREFHKDQDARSQSRVNETFVESNTTWIGQEGGCEGLRQKGWTTVTSGSLLVAEYCLGIRSIITGQGDNQVIVAFFPVPKEYKSPEEYLDNNQEDLEKNITEYLKFLKHISVSIGMNIKLEETWVSRTLFNYGKEILSHGVFTTSVLKKLSRAYLSVSDNYPSLSNRIASLHTAGHSASLKNIDPLLPYFVSIHEICILIQLEVSDPLTTGNRLSILLREKKLELTKDLLLFLVIFPKDYGGYPVMCFYDYIYRGHPDPVTSHLCWLNKNSERIPIALKILQWVLSLDGVKSSQDYKMIIQDPVSLNWNRAVNGVNVIKNNLESTLRAYVKNTDIKQLMRGCTGPKKDGIIEYLSHTVPFSPRVLNTIFRNSPEGARLDFISTFTDMRTLKNLCPGKQMVSLRSQLKECDIQWFNHILNTYVRIQNRSLWYNSYRKALSVLNYSSKDVRIQNICTTKIADFLRRESWQKEIHHVTVPHPMEQTLLIPGSPDSSDNPVLNKKEYVLYIYKPPKDDREPNITMLSDPRFSAGEFTPYYGSGTAPKVSSRLISFAKTDRSTTAAQSLLKTKLWVTEEGSSFSTFISALIKTRTPLSEKTLRAATGSFSGGSVAHRFDDVVTKHESRPNMRVNFFSHTYFSSDTMGKYSRGLENFTMHFQGIFLTGLYGIQHNVVYGINRLTPPPVFYQVINCEDCCQRVEDVFLHNEAPVPPIQAMKNCSLLYSDIPDTGNKMTWQDTGCVRLAGVGNKTSNKDKRRALAAGWILLGQSSEMDSPLVHTPLKRFETYKPAPSLSIANCLILGVENIIYSATKLWFLENVCTLLRTSQTLGIDLHLIARSYLIRTSKVKWSCLRELMLHPDIRDHFLRVTGLFPGSSNAFRGSSSLDILVSSYASDCLEEIIKAQDFRVALFCSTSGVTVTRCVTIWASSLALCSYGLMPKKVLRLIRKITVCLTESRVKDSFSFETFLLLLIDLKNDFPKLPDVIQDYPFVISQEGPEPWVKVKGEAEITGFFKKYETTHQAGRLEKREMWKSLRGLKLLKDTRYITSFSRSMIAPTETRWDDKNHSQFSFKTEDAIPYYEHSIKTTGLYSSSHYKFLSVLLRYNLSDVKNAICIGDGDGGVTRLLHATQSLENIWYNSLIDISSFPPHRAISYCPPELIELKGLNKIRGIELCITIGGDITDKRYSQSLLADVKDTPINLIISDAECHRAFSTTQLMNILNSVLSLARGVKGHPTLIFKTYYQNSRDLSLMINQILCFSDKVDVVCPVLSATSSQECFLVSKLIHKSSYLLKTDLSWTWNTDVIEILLGDSKSLSSVDNVTYFNQDKIKKDIKALNRQFMDMGYPSSLPMALQILVGDYLDPAGFLSDPLTILSQTSELLHNLILNRIKTFGDIIETRKHSKLDYSLRGNYLSESGDIDFLCTLIFNITIMTQALVHLQVDNSVFTAGVHIHHCGKVIYHWVPDYHRWRKRFGRSWYKFWGWAQAVDPLKCNELEDINH